MAPTGGNGLNFGTAGGGGFGLKLTPSAVNAFMSRPDMQLGGGSTQSVESTYYPQPGSADFVGPMLPVSLGQQANSFGNAFWDHEQQPSTLGDGLSNVDFRRNGNNAAQKLGPITPRGVLLDEIDQTGSKQALYGLATSNANKAKLLADVALDQIQKGNIDYGQMLLKQAKVHIEAADYATQNADGIYTYVPPQSTGLTLKPGFSPFDKNFNTGAYSAGLSSNLYSESRTQAQIDASLGRTTTLLATSPLWVPLVGAAAAYSPLGFSLGFGGDAAGQYYQNGEVRLSQSLFSGVTGSGAFTLAARLPAITSWGTGALTVGGNATIGGATAVANTSFNNSYYQESTSLFAAGGLGAVASAGGTLFGNWTSRFLTTLMPSAAHIPVSGTPWTIPAQGTLNIAPLRIGNTVSNTIGAVPAFIPLDNGVKKNK